jgi:hypothetical protein
VTIFSLLLCMTISALWVRSHHVQDDYNTGVTSYTSRWGSLIVVHFYSYPPDSDLSASGYTAAPVRDTNRAWALLDQLKTRESSAWGAGLAWLQSGPLKAWKLTMPFWMLVLLTEIAPLAWIVWRLRKRNIPGSEDQRA